MLPPVRVLVPMELAAELGDAALEIGRGAREERLALERAEVAHDRHVVPQVGLGEADADAGRLGRARGRPGVEHRARLHHPGVAGMEKLQRREGRGHRLVFARDVGLPRRVVDSARRVVRLVGEDAPAAGPHHVVVRVDEPRVDRRPPGVDGADRARPPPLHHFPFRADGGHPPAAHRHRSRREHAALRVDADDVRVADEEVASPIVVHGHLLAARAKASASSSTPRPGPSGAKAKPDSKRSGVASRSSLW